MTDAALPVLAEAWRGPFLESVHRGHAVVARPDGAIVEAWGDPDAVVLPRSSVKMIQALPLVESGAADRAGLTERQIALATASHEGAAVHIDMARDWLAGLGLTEDDLACGPQPPRDRAERERLRREGGAPSRLHNNCSGKHCGFLTLARDLAAGPGYTDPDHAVQRAVVEAMEALAGEPVRGHGIDGCSAPNYAISMGGLARAMARFARPDEALSGARAKAAARIRDAMIAHPVLVAGEGRACTDLMRAMGGRAAVKTGAEGVYCAILPEAGLGLAVKIADGATRGAEAAIAALLARHGALDRGQPIYGRLADQPLINWAGLDCGRFRAADLG